MNPEEALRNIGDWISEETQKRKYDKATVIELSDSLITLKEAIKKQIPKKVTFRSEYLCGNCNVTINSEDCYCFNCGQCQDWSEGE